MRQGRYVVREGARRWRVAFGLGATTALLAATGCGGASHDDGGIPTSPAVTRTSTTGTTPRDVGAHRVPALHVLSRHRLPAPVQLPALARLSDGTVLAMGGLDAADQSVADVVRVAPGAARRVGALDVPAHDLGAAALGDRAYAFGGGTASGPLAAIRRVTRAGAVQPAGQLPVALSDASAATIGDTIYVVGGETATTPLRSVLAFRPGARVRDVATLPHPLRYAAVAAVGGRLVIAGGTDGLHGRREILSVDPAVHRVRLLARLPAPLSHAAAAALGGRVFVLGGRGDAPTAQRAAIWVVDPGRGTVRRAGRLPVALSDLGAVAAGDRILVAGGRDRTGTVHDEVWTLGTR